jgi:hypothetical protein
MSKPRMRYVRQSETYWCWEDNSGLGAGKTMDDAYCCYLRVAALRVSRSLPRGRLKMSFVPPKMGIWQRIKNRLYKHLVK